jgi:uncharacterized protein (TIRG00374 family)
MNESPLIHRSPGEAEAVATSSPLTTWQRPRIDNKPLRFLSTCAIYLTLIALLYFALRNAPLIEIWHAIYQLKLWQIAALIVINITIYLLVTLRWWIIVHTGNKTISFLPLVLIRVAVFGVSYFTLGPQIGGEPLQVLFLQRRYGMTYTRATSTVIMDKLLEFLANFFLLVIGLTAVVKAGFLFPNGGQTTASLILMAAILSWPFIHIALMMRGVYPIGAALRAAFSRFGNPKWMRFIIAAERMAGMFCQRTPRALWAAMGVSLLACAGMISEYVLITSFLGINLHHWQTIAGWTTSWLAFLVPLPGGLGALEASQVFTLGAFEISAALAIGVVFLIRARDLLIGGLGLLLASRGVRK